MDVRAAVALEAGKPLTIETVKLAQTGEGEGACPPPFTTFTITSKVTVYAPAEWAETLTLFHL